MRREPTGCPGRASWWPSPSPMSPARCPPASTAKRSTGWRRSMPERVGAVGDGEAQAAATPEQVALRRLATALERIDAVDRTLPRQYREGVRDGLKIAARTAREIADEW